MPDFANSQSLNRYSYVLNNALRYTDPTGHYEFEENSNDQFFIPSRRSPTGQTMRMIGDTCFGECRGKLKEVLVEIDEVREIIAVADTGSTSLGLTLNLFGGKDVLKRVYFIMMMPETGPLAH